MSTTAAQFPGLTEKLGSDAKTTAVEEHSIGGIKYLRVTQTFAEGEGEQRLFAVTAKGVDLLKVDNAVEFPNPEFVGGRGYAGTMSDEEHAEVAAEAIASVDVFKTGQGPGNGSVACMWAARTVVFNAVDQWITHTDGTATFYTELQQGGMTPVASDGLPDGAIIISPTTPRAIGHIGLLGAGTGRDRLVYSNHSPSAADPVARWKQNYTVGSFTDGHTAKGLQTLFYRLPKPATL